MEQQTAKRFFDQLETFSQRCRSALGIGRSPSMWGQEKLVQPQGAILHYTADDSTANVVRYFTDIHHDSKASAHVVIAAQKESWAAGLDTDLDLIAQLGVTVVQCRLPDQGAWHATWTNATCYGVENVNVGEVKRQADGTLVWWAPRDAKHGEWTSPFKGRAPKAMFNRLWEPYTPAQLMANVTVLRALNAFHGYSLQAPWVLGHDNVQGIATVGGGGHDKRDPGPLFPLHEIRAVVFQSAALAEATKACANPDWPWQWRRDLASLVGPSAATRADPWTLFMQTVTAKNAMLQSPHFAKATLRALGYYVQDLLTETWTSPDTQSLRIFQRMAGLADDGQLGPRTAASLVERLTDRCGQPTSLLA